MQSLVIVGFPVPKVICSIDDEIGSINVVPLAGSLKHLRVMHDTVFVEVYLLILNITTLIRSYWCPRI